MNQEEIMKLRRLVDELMFAQTKNDALTPYRKLNFAASIISSDIPSNAALKLQEVIVYAKDASGQISDKSHWVSCVESSWYVFESLVLKQ